MLLTLQFINIELAMMKLLLCSTLLVFLSGSLMPVNGQHFYNPSEISEINIAFYDADWDHKLDSLMTADSDARILADITINGMVFDSVGVRYKGNSSYNASQAKNPLNIKLDYIKGHEYEGYNSLKLSNLYKDPSFVREVLAYEIAGKYMPASRAGYANVYFNGLKNGLYTNVQVVDDIFTSEHYFSENRPFFEGDDVSGPPPMGCFTGAPMVWGYMGTDSTNCYPKFYDMKVDNTWSYLISFLDTFNNYTSMMENIYDVDRHLWAMAFDIGLVNLDAPISMAHNFYLYYGLDNRFHYAKWDLNECFGVFVSLGYGPSSTFLNTTQMQQLDPFAGNSSANPVVYKVWQNTRWKRMYIAHMKTIFEENIDNGWYLTRAQELQAIVDTAVLNDPNKLYSYTDFQNNLTATASGSVGITELMIPRWTYLSSNTWFTATQPEISNIATSPSTVLPNSSVVITAEISNASEVFLGYRSNIADRFTKTNMYDDGAHGDGAAADGIFGTSVPVLESDVQYYIYADNANAGRFSPARAEYEYYTIDVNGNVVINEIMASNSATATDQDNESDDWIELYNTSASPVSLNGYYLSDEFTITDKWQFPDTIINGYDYLIVWADNDTLQSGLHASFKLSAAGEAVALFTPAKSLVDQISFSAQSSDISYGRYPNGSGSFQLMNPTFSSQNSPWLGFSHTPNTVGVNIFPNPANDKVSITFNDDAAHLIQIYNLQGCPVFYRTAATGLLINTSTFESGVYLVLIDNHLSNKLVITK